MIVIIDKITLEYFGSVKKLTYNFNRPGLNIIAGKNGSGKTSIFNALSWVLYGKLIKKGSSITPWPIIRGKDYKGTLVHLKILRGKDVIEIYRGLDYLGNVLDRKIKSGILIVVNGEIQDRLRDKNDAQKYIIDLIGYSFELFKNSVLFGQRLKRLMGEDNATKKKILEEAFEVDFIAKAREIVDKKLMIAEADDTRLRLERANIEDRLTAIKNHKDQLERLKEAFKANRTKKLEELRNELAVRLDEFNGSLQSMGELNDLRIKLEELEKSVDVVGISKREFELDMQRNTIGSKVEEYKKRRSTILDKLRNPELTCSVCGSELSKSKVIKVEKSLEFERGQLDKAISKLQEKLLKVEARYAKIKKKLDSLKKIENKIIKYKSRIKFLERAGIAHHELSGVITSLRKEITRVKSEKWHGDLNINPEEEIRLKENLITLNADINKNEEKYSLYKWMVKDPLSNSGMKAFIIDSMAREVNKVLRSLKPIVGFDIKLSVNLESAHKDVKISVFKEKLKIPYEDLSGGQQQLIDISIAWAMEKVTTAKRPINIMLPDEVFESLDQDNIQAVGELLLIRSREKSIHLVTHQSSFNPLNANKTVLTLNEGVTEVEA